MDIHFGVLTLMPLEFLTANSEYVLIADNALLDVGSADFCSMCWFRVTSVGDSIFTKGAFVSGTAGWQLRMNQPVGLLLAVFSDGSGGFDVVTGPEVDDDVWRHAAIVRDGGAGLFRLYVNGVQVATTAIGSASGSLNNSLDMLIGATHDGAGSPAEFITGAVDDARFYDRLVSADEILTVFTTRGHDGIKATARYTMREKEPGAAAAGAGVVKDVGENGLDGTPANTPTYSAGELSFGRRIA